MQNFKRLSSITPYIPESRLKRQRLAQGFPYSHLTLSSLLLFPRLPSLKSLQLVYVLWEFRVKGTAKVCKCRYSSIWLSRQHLFNQRAKNFACLLFKRGPRAPFPIPTPSHVWPQSYYLGQRWRWGHSIVSEEIPFAIWLQNILYLSFPKVLST